MCRLTSSISLAKSSMAFSARWQASCVKGKVSCSTVSALKQHHNAQQAPSLANPGAQHPASEQVEAVRLHKVKVIVHLPVAPALNDASA